MMILMSCKTIWYLVVEMKVKHVVQYILHAAISLLCFVIPGFLPAQTLPDRPNPPQLINDFAGVFSTDETTALEQKLVAYYDSTSTQIAVVTLQSLDGYPIDDYAFKLGNKWGIGEKGKNNGLLILVAVADRKAFIATGYGMEGALNDGKLGTILRNEILPYFKGGSYYQGIDNGINSIMAAAAGEYKSNGKQKKPIDSTTLLIIIGIVFIIFGLGLFTSYRAAKRYSILNNVPFWVAWSIINAASRNTSSRGGGFWGGGGGGGFSGGGGFGGFGGGSFGGGGAGGSW
jgi:uncharacterized protein